MVIRRIVADLPGVCYHAARSRIHVHEGRGIGMSIENIIYIIAAIATILTVGTGFLGAIRDWQELSNQPGGVSGAVAKVWKVFRKPLFYVAGATLFFALGFIVSRQDQANRPVVPTPTPVPLRQQVKEFLTRAIEAEVRAYRTSDPSPLYDYFSIEQSTGIKEAIRRLKDAGHYRDAVFDPFDLGRSSLLEPQRQRDMTIVVESCEYWYSQEREQQTDRVLYSGEGLEPQRITIDESQEHWLIIEVEYRPAPSFCP